MKKTLLIFFVCCSIQLSAQIAFQKAFVIGLEPTNRSSAFKSVIELNDGSLLIGGNYGNGRLFTTKIAANGDSLWTKTYHYPGFVSGSMVKLFRDNEGALTLCGTVTRQGAGSWFYLFRLNEEGDTVYTKRFAINGAVKDLVQLEDSGYVFTTNNQNINGRIYRVNKEMGQVWSYMPFPDQIDSIPLNTLFNGIKYHDGALYISARWSLSGMAEVYLSKWDLDGKKIFFKKYANGQGMSIVDMEVTKQNNCLLIGNQTLNTFPKVSTDGFAIMRTTANGDSIDVQYVDGPSTDNAYTINEGQNQYLVTGMGSSSDYPQVVTVVGLDETGKIKWNSNLKILNQANTSYQPTHSGQYAIETKDGHIVVVGFKNSNTMGGPAESYVAKFKPTINTGISLEHESKIQFKLYPNPLSQGGKLKIINNTYSALQKSFEVKLINMLGAVVYEAQESFEPVMEFNIPKLTAGVYSVISNNQFLGKIQVVE
jgi:hypothetical protein